ncbi:ADP-ribosyltransferase [Pseudomonas sichuanensis]|uniref:ADP-ribosyltransferase n=1 Tax=Pseudomonas sichuanensis TaxID=2213015 RepID=UPI0021606FF5|nr:ADP-ribosyltransferase [Pseudomonas sichuanensis]UVK82194.1 ADP-ribosyltransferase [Pseudomonas sichuanensis]
MSRLSEVIVDHVNSDARYLRLEKSVFSEFDVPVDYLLVMTLPGDYTDASSDQYPIVRYLRGVGVDLVQEHGRREVDMYPHMPCWVSSPLSSQPLKRLVVFECDRDSLDGRYLWTAYETTRLAAGSVGSFKVVNAMLMGLDTQQPEFTYMLRQAFFASVSCAARVSLVEAYLLVEPDQGKVALEEFNSLSRVYMDPPSRPVHLEALHRRLHLTNEVKRQQRTAGLNLTNRQFDAIYRYTRTAYLSVNAALRKNDLTDPSYLNCQALIEAISSGLANLDNFIWTEGQGLFRSMSYFDGFDSVYRVGQRTRELAFTSTTKDASATVPGSGIRFYMSSHTGKEIELISDFPEEQEVLFDCGMQHMIMRVMELADMVGPGYSKLYKAYDSNQDLANSSGARFLHL